MILRLPKPSLQRLRAPLSVLLLILAADGAARLFWAWWPLPATALPGTPVAPRPPDTARTAALARLPELHLFGNLPNARPTPAPVAASSRNLRLLGILWGQNGAPSRALIAEGNGEEQVYAEGQSLAGGTLARIALDHVNIAYNGRHERLDLPAPASEGMAPVYASDSADSSEPLDGSALTQRLREMGGRIENLTDLLQVEPHLLNQQFAGLRLRPGRDPRLFGQLSLQNGDVLVEIDGQRLVDPAQAMTLIQHLTERPTLDVRILRKGQEIPLTYRLHAP